MRVNVQRKSGMPFNTKLLIERDDDEQTLTVFLDDELFPDVTAELVAQLLEIAATQSNATARAALRPVAG